MVLPMYDITTLSWLLSRLLITRNTLDQSLKHLSECRSANMAVRDGSVVAGGFQGELICKQRGIQDFKVGCTITNFA
ncbi:hypothetical protein P3L10_022897 [Capsicum annuum]